MAAVSNQFRSVIDANLCLQEEAQLYDPNAERAILALIAQYPALLMEVERNIPPEWFFSDLHRYIYKVMSFVARGCVNNGWPIAFDAVTVSSVARQFGQQAAESFARKTNGMERWHSIVNFSQYVSIDVFARHMATMREASARVELYRILRKNQVAVASGIGPIDHSVGELICGVERIRESHTVCRKVVLAESAAAALTDESYRRRVFCPTYPVFSGLINGFRPGSLLILAGRSKVGKSKIVTRASLGFAHGDVWVKYLDSEMDDKEVAMRQLSMLTGLSEDKLRNPAHAAERDAGMKVLTALSGRIDYQNISEATTDQIMASIHDFRRKIGPDALGVVIYDWLMNTDPTGRIPEHIALGDLTTRIKQTAAKTQLPIIALTQQNRAALSATHGEQSGAGEAYVSGSDRIVHKSTTVCHIRAVPIELQGAIFAQFGCAKFTHILSIDVSRFGKSRQSIPIFAEDDTNRMKEVADQATTDFLEEYNQAAKKPPKAFRLPPVLPAPGHA